MRSFPLLLVVGLAGCTDTAHRYPSLLPRPIEGQSLAEPERPAPVASADAALDAQITELRRALQTAATRFAAAAQDAEAKVAVARGVPEGSESWLSAQTALSGLGAHRSTTVDTLAALEALAIARGVEGLPAYPALDEAVAAADAQATAQGDRLLALEAALAGA